MHIFGFLKTGLLNVVSPTVPINDRGRVFVRHVEPCRGIPHTHPAKETCDSEERLQWPANKNTTVAISPSMWGVEQECRRKRGQRRWAGYFLVMDSPMFSLTQLSFTSSIRHPPLLSEAVTPGRCTSLTTHAAFLSPQRNHWLSDTEQRTVDWPRGPVEKEKLGRAVGGGISGLTLTCGHSSEKFYTAQCVLAQHSPEP